MLDGKEFISAGINSKATSLLHKVMFYYKRKTFLFQVKMKGSEYPVAKIKNLKAEMAKHGLNMNALAEAIGICESSLYRKMRGEVSFQLWEVQKIKDVLHLSLERVGEIFFDN